MRHHIGIKIFRTSLIILLSSFGLSQEGVFVPRKKILRLETKINTDNYLDCNKVKSVNKFKSQLSDQEMIYFLKNGSPSIRLITTEHFFSLKYENSPEVIEIFQNFNNELVYLCNYVGHDYLLNYILFRVESEKYNNIEVYNLLILIGGKEPDKNEG